MISRLGNLFWIVLVTLLLWIYADLEFTDNLDTEITLRLVTDDAGKIVLLSKPDHEIAFTVTGGRFMLDTVRRELISRGNVVVYNTAGEYEKGRETKAVTTSELLSRALADADISTEGLTIHKANPETIELHLDRMRRIPDVPVTLNCTGAELPAPPQPRKVAILIPSSKAEVLLDAIDSPKFSLSTAPVDLSGYKPGEHKVIGDVYPVLDGLKFDVEPRSVEFDVVITNPTQTRTMKVPVNIITPSTWGEKGDNTWKDYVLTLSPDSSWRPELSIAGLPQYLKPENVLAFVRLTDEDKKPIESWLQREVVVTFPPEMNLYLAGNRPKIKFRLEKRQPVKSITP